MIDWGNIQFARVWPLWLATAVAATLVCLWLMRRRTLIPDITPVISSAAAKGLVDRLPVGLGAMLMLLLMLVMMEPAVLRVETVDQRARDFLILVDTSRSMRHDTGVRRDSFDLNFERRVGAFSTAVNDPSAIPFIARYELARESLLTFLSMRHSEDRVGLIYFNDEAHAVSALTANIDFVVDQLSAMDDYVNWGTDIASAMNTGLGMLQRFPDQNRRTVVLLTDAETRYTKELEQQLSRLAGDELSFYLLWITTDENDRSNEELVSFLELARSVGTVVTIDDPDSNNLRDALVDISRMEAYSYQDERRRHVDLSPPLMRGIILLLVIWLPLMATVFHPSGDKGPFQEHTV